MLREFEGENEVKKDSDTENVGTADILELNEALLVGMILLDEAFTDFEWLFDVVDNFETLGEPLCVSAVVKVFVRKALPECVPVFDKALLCVASVDTDADLILLRVSV